MDRPPEHLEADESRGRTHSALRQPQPQEPKPAGVLSGPPIDQHAYHQRAVEACRRGDFQKALQYFSRTIELDRLFAPAWIGQIEMLLELGSMGQADLWTSKALELFTGHGDLLAARAVAHARRGETKAALGDSEAALRTRGHGARRWLARGEALLAAASDQAWGSFENALLEPDADWYTRVCAARILRRHGRFTPALRAAQEATRLAPESPFAWYVRGLCERDLAIGAFRGSFARALEIDATYIAARKALRESPAASWVVRMLRRIRGV